MTPAGGCWPAFNFRERVSYRVGFLVDHIEFPSAAGGLAAHARADRNRHCWKHDSGNNFWLFGILAIAYRSAGEYALYRADARCADRREAVFHVFRAGHG